MNYLANINNLRTFNYENLATNKMQYININVIINSIIKLKDVLKTNNHLNKYIKHAKPYNISNIKLDSDVYKNKNKIGAILNKKNNLHEKSIPKKLGQEIINFNNQNIKRNFYFTRMCNIERKKINSNFIDKIILIQKNIRGFLSKKIIYSSINNEIAKNIIKSVIIIQKAFRKFLLNKKSLDNYIIKIINKERNDKGNKIIQIFSKFHYRNIFLKNLIIKKIVITRHISAQLIQSTFKSYILRRIVKDIINKEKKSYVLIYPFEAKSIQIKIFNKGLNNKCKIYDYIKCPIRKFFVAYVYKKEIKPGEYYCQMKVNNNIIIDKRYKSAEIKDNLYNLIPIGNYKKKKKIELKKNINNKSKDIHKKINDELDNFYFYYYSNDEDKENSNDLSHSKNSDFSNNENKVKKINYLNQIDEDDPDQVIDISNTKNNYKFSNSFLKSNYNYVKDYNTQKKKKEEYEKRIKNIYDNLYNIKEDIDNGSIHNSECLNYNSILDELSQSAKSITSNISMNINSYSKKTHKAKFKKDDKSKNKKASKRKVKKDDIKF